MKNIALCLNFSIVLRVFRIRFTGCSLVDGNNLSTCGFKEFLSRAEDDVAVPVCAEKKPHQSPSVCHANPHVLVKQPLEFLPSLGGWGHFRLLLRVDREVTLFVHLLLTINKYQELHEVFCWILLKNQYTGRLFFWSDSLSNISTFLYALIIQKIRFLLQTNNNF